MKITKMKTKIMITMQMEKLKELGPISKKQQI